MPVSLCSRKFTVPLRLYGSGAPLNSRLSEDFVVYNLRMIEKLENAALNFAFDCVLMIVSRRIITRLTTLVTGVRSGHLTVQIL